MIYICKVSDNDSKLHSFEKYLGNAWSDNIYDARNYANQRPEIDYELIVADTKKCSISDAFKRITGFNELSDVEINDYKINAYSTDTIHPCTVYVTNEQLSEFEIRSCETCSMDADVDMLGSCLCRLYLLMKYLPDFSPDEIKPILSCLFAKYMVFDIFNSGYDYYDDDDDNDDMYKKYKLFSEAINIDLSASSVYEFIDEFSRYNIIVNKYNGGVL